MSPPHKGATEATGLVARGPQLAAALRFHNRHHQAPESSHPRGRFPRQRQPRANVSTPYRRQGWVSPRPRARFPSQRPPRANVSTPQHRLEWVSLHPPPAKEPLRLGHPPTLRQQDVSKGALRAVEQQWLLLPFARLTVTLEHTGGGIGTMEAMATIVAALVIMTAAGAGAVLEPASP